MRHIAVFLPSLQGGGAERAMTVLANGFAARGLRVDLVLAKADGPYLSEVSKAVRVVDLGKRRVLASMVPLARYLRRERPDAMISALNHANIIAILARMLARIDLALAVSERNSVSRMSNGITGRITWFLMRLLYRRADRIVCVSRGIEEELATGLGLAEDRLCTIYNPLDVDGIRRQMMPAPDHPWFDAGAAPVVVAVGRLTAQKDYPTLLRAFDILRTRKNAKLVILGEGEERSALSDLAERLGISGEVDFVGFQDNPYRWMAAARLYVMSSAWEGLPGGLLQAMACGTPVVSTNCPTGPAEILEDGRWGRLVEVGDDRALAQAMEAALNDDTPPPVQDRADAFKIEYAVERYLEAIAPRRETCHPPRTDSKGNVIA